MLYLIKTILSYVGKYKKESVLSAVTMIGEVSMEVLIPLVMAKIIDIGVQGDGGTAYIVRMGFLMMGMSVLSLLCGCFSARLASAAAMGVGANIRMALFKKITDFSFFNTDKFQTSSLITRLTTDITNTQMAYQMVIRMCFRAPIMFILSLVMAIKINVSLSAVFTVVIPVWMIALVIAMKCGLPRFLKMFKMYDRMNAVVQENLTGMRVVKAFVREDGEKEKFGIAAGDLYSTSIAAEKLLVLANPVMQFGIFVCTVFVAWFGARLVINSSLGTGELISYFTYIQQILNSILSISMILVSLVTARASISRICEVLNEEIDITDEGTNPELTVENGDIKFDHVDFSFSKDKDKLTLSDINLEIKSGETIGVLGSTGSGKSTLTQLIPRLYDVLDGAVYVGGRNVKEYPLKELRNKVAMVLQKNLLFSGTIKENLRWGNKDATDEEIIDACKQAQAHDFIMSFPEKYDTMLDQGGRNLSGGQRQRLCIARALLKKPCVLILDDSTSAVDMVTDAAIRSSLKNTQRDVTTIIIAQRINSVQSVDRIVVMNKGRIDAVGKHDDLIKTNEIYKEIYYSQQKGDED